MTSVLAHRFGFLIILVSLAACQKSTAKGQGAPNQKPEDLAQVLARIDDVNITVGDFQERINKQSPYVRARYNSIERKKEFLDNLVRFEVLAKEAERKGLQSDPEVVRTMKQVMIQRLMKDEFESKMKPEDIGDEECKAYYDKHPEEFNKPEEVRVAHILVKDEKTAKKVMADPRIKGIETADFRNLVAEYSTDQATKDRGGDLRYFDANTKEVPAEIVKAAFPIANIGDVAGPIKVAQGFEIVKLTGRRKAFTRAFDEDTKKQIRARLFRDKRQTGMEDYVKGLRAKTKIELFEDRLGKVVVESGGPAGPGGNVPPPGPGMFHPGAPGAPHAGPAMPGMPPAAKSMSMPRPAAPTPQ